MSSNAQEGKRLRKRRPTLSCRRIDFGCLPSEQVARLIQDVLRLRSVSQDLKENARYKAILDIRLEEVAATLRILLDENSIPVVLWYVTNDAVLDRVLRYAVSGLARLRQVDPFSGILTAGGSCLCGRRGAFVYELNFLCGCSGITAAEKCKSFRSITRIIEDEAERLYAALPDDSCQPPFGKAVTVARGESVTNWPIPGHENLSFQADRATDEIRLYMAELRTNFAARLIAAQSLRQRNEIIEDALREIGARFEPIRSVIAVTQELYISTGDTVWDQASDDAISNLVEPFRESTGYVRNAHTLRSRHIPAQIERSVQSRDCGHCIVCGTTNDLQLDHIVPFIKGGEHAASNLRLLCEACHGRRHMIAFLPDRIDSLEEIAELDSAHIEELRDYIRAGSDPKYIANYPEPFKTALRRQWQNGGRLYP